MTEAPVAKRPASEAADMFAPLLAQIPGMDQKTYLEWVHTPFDFPTDPKTGKVRLARLFKWDFCEMFSHTVWWVVPLVWVPVATLGLCSWAVMNGRDPALLAMLTVGGILLWWVIEYSLHRFIFHMDENLPNHPVARTIHFLLHGVHHKVPMDRFRLVMPPVLLSVLALSVYPVVRAIFFAMPLDLFHYLFGVALLGYVGYDVFHYSFHFLSVESLPGFIGDSVLYLKHYHLKHHYDNHHLGYGITTVTFDRFLGTEIPASRMPKLKKAA
ncbi:hypothetical protein FNF28_03111 [Cafeteria roenbergensis]|nr:hypothetical protein FNF28_03111 [Cafeteria roenbergensis]